MAKKIKKTFPAARKFVLRRDASVGTGEIKIETVFGLPDGCVQLMLPNGKRARSDKKINMLLKEWGW
jgi:hypothetical protein